MRRSNRGNMLLLELAVVIALFMLSATVLLSLFSEAHRLSVRAEISAQALSDARNLAAELYAAEDVHALLEEKGASRSGAVWTMDCGRYRMEIGCTMEKKPAGMLHISGIRAVSGEETLLVLPCARYRAEEAQP